MTVDDNINRDKFICYVIDYVLDDKFLLSLSSYFTFFFSQIWATL